MTAEKVYVLLGLISGAVNTVEVYDNIKAALAATSALVDACDIDPDETTHEQYADLDYYHTPDYEGEVILYHDVPVIAAPGARSIPDADVHGNRIYAECLECPTYTQDEIKSGMCAEWCQTIVEKYPPSP